jgi:multicomponent Na+:H+ antiporter subunit D
LTPALAVVAPLAAATAAVLVPGRLVTRAGLLGSALAAAAGVAVLWAVAAEGTQEHRSSGWAPPLGVELRADGLAAVLVGATAVIALVTSVAAAEALRARPLRTSVAFWPSWLLLWAALYALLLAGDLFTAYVALELVTLAAVALVTLGGGREALRAAMRYLLAALAGSLFFLLGVAVVLGRFGRMDLTGLAEVATPSAGATAALALLTAGLALKAALFPLHAWLPPAHGAAPAPVSAALSALVVTAAAVLALRIWVVALPGLVPGGAATLLGALGAGAVVWGSLQALAAERMKLVVAHSTVAQLGYVFIAVPLALGGAAADQAWAGGVVHAVAHAAAKASLFLLAGVALAAAGHDRVNGLVLRGPLVAAALGLAGASLAGLPPTGGFTGKWLLLTAAIEQGAWWWAVVIVAGGVLALGYVGRLVRLALVTDDEADEGLRPTSQVPQACALVLAALAVALGLWAGGLVDVLGAPAS